MGASEQVVREVEVIKEVPVEKIVVQEIIKEVPIEKIAVQKVIQEVEVIKEVIKEVVKEVAVQPAPRPKRTLVFAGLDWDSVRVQNGLARYMIEKGYGHET